MVSKQKKTKLFFFIMNFNWFNCTIRFQINFWCAYLQKGMFMTKKKREKTARRKWMLSNSIWNEKKNTIKKFFNKCQIILIGIDCQALVKKRKKSVIQSYFPLLWKIAKALFAVLIIMAQSKHEQFYKKKLLFLGSFMWNGFICDSFMYSYGGE